VSFEDVILKPLKVALFSCFRIGGGKADEVDLLIVPSNGFAPYYNLETFSRNFEDFLSSGGNALGLRGHHR
jgi:hypothetical protein